MCAGSIIMVSSVCYTFRGKLDEDPNTDTQEAGIGGKNKLLINKTSHEDKNKVATKG